jgi:hypothetical protein
MEPDYRVWSLSSVNPYQLCDWSQGWAVDFILVASKSRFMGLCFGAQHYVTAGNLGARDWAKFHRVFLGALAELLEATISFVMPVYSWNTSAPTGRIFIIFCIWV